MLANSVIAMALVFSVQVNAQQPPNGISTFKMMRNADRAGNQQEVARLAFKIIQEGDNPRYSPTATPTQILAAQLSTRGAAEEYLAVYYDQGIVFGRNHAQAAYYYERTLADYAAANRYEGTVRSPRWDLTARLGALYGTGLGVQRDKAKARAIFATLGQSGAELIELLDANRLPPGDVDELRAAARGLRSEQAAKQEAQAAAQARREAAIAARNPPPSRSSRGSSSGWQPQTPSGLTCHHMGGMGAIAGCAPWSW
jgi:hypothetical protein